SGYYEAGDHGGGMFMWQTNLERPLPEDGGRYIAPMANAARGRWVRLLHGGAANGKIGGARGDSKTIESGCIQKALDACLYPFSGEMLSPTGQYLVNTTMVFSSQVHIRGEGNGNNSRILMLKDLDVFRTKHAQTAFESGTTPVNYDEDLI